MAATKTTAELKTLFSDVKNVYFRPGDPLLVKDIASLSALTDFIELPVLEGGVTFDTGAAEKTEVKLTTGEIWTSKIDKGDSDISFQVASVDDTINNTFLEKNTKLGTSGEITANINGVAVKGHGYANSPKKVLGVIVMVDESGENFIVLPSVEMFGSLVSDNDNPAYFNVSVTPVTSSDNVSILIFNKSKSAA